MWRFLLLGLSCWSLAVLAGDDKAPKALPEITNLKQISTQLKLSDFKDKPFTRKLKVAVLDNGFYGYEAEIGKSLPADTQFHIGKASAADQIESKAFHGLYMAKIIADLIKTSGAKADYELHLFNTFGYTKFADAVDTVIKDKFDIVLYSQVWEFGGNGDGKGFINALVDKAVAAGIVWVNAAGNFGRLTNMGPIDSGDVQWVTFKDKKGKTSDKLKIFCRVPPSETCNLRLILSWNDFKEESEAGTDKDLDLFVYNSKNEEIASSKRIQKLKKDTSNDQNSVVPRELIEKSIAPGTYTLKIENKSKNFAADKDVFRITASGLGVEIENPSMAETLLPPADNSGVLVVGASDDFQSSRSEKNKRPDIYIRSVTTSKDNSTLFSTSNAAAMIAAVVTLHVGTGAEAKREVLVGLMKNIARKADQDVVKIEGNVAFGPGNGRRPLARRSEPRPRMRPGYDYGPDSDMEMGPYSQGAQDPYYYGGAAYMPAPMAQMGYGYGGGVGGYAYGYEGGGFGGGCAMINPAALPVMYPGVAWIQQIGGVFRIGPYGRPVIYLNPAVADGYGLLTRVPGQRVFLTAGGPAYLYPDQMYEMQPDFYEIIPAPVPPGCGAY